ncbi:MAG: cell division protein CrgA [Nitriliruptoraceae bacterium]|nr:cell division protein CrgA [Nitriliruptoraceae bacterium]
MPESRHRRGGKKRPRDFETHAPETKAAPSPTWVPATGASLLGLGVLIILLGYIDEVRAFTRTIPLTGTNTGLILGFVCLIAGFGFLSRWR